MRPDQVWPDSGSVTEPPTVYCPAGCSVGAQENSAVGSGSRHIHGNGKFVAVDCGIGIEIKLNQTVDGDRARVPGEGRGLADINRRAVGGPGEYEAGGQRAFRRADVHSDAGEPRLTALVDRKRVAGGVERQGIAARINREAPREQRVGRRRAAVIAQKAKHGVERHGGRAGLRVRIGGQTGRGRVTTPIRL